MHCTTSCRAAAIGSSTQTRHRSTRSGRSPASETWSRPATSTGSARAAFEPYDSATDLPDRAGIRGRSVRRCLSEEVSELIGGFHIPDPDELANLVGRRRAASMQRGTR